MVSCQTRGMDPRQETPYISHAFSEKGPQSGGFKICAKKKIRPVEITPYSYIMFNNKTSSTNLFVHFAKCLPTSTKSAAKIHHFSTIYNMDFSTQPTYKNPTQVDQNFPPVETWMSSRSLEPLQPSPWVALAPSPTLVWPAKKKTRPKLDINPRFMATPGHGAKIQDSNCFFWKKNMPAWKPS